MEEMPVKQTEAQRFNTAAKEWENNIPHKNYDIARHLIDRLQIPEGGAVLDVACGTGILFSILKDVNISRYTGIDIADKMVEEFLSVYPQADVRCVDFESELTLEGGYDYVIIYNSIPHFNDLDMVFKNAYKCLKQNGTFAIAHSKTRKGLREHHRKIGYVSGKKHPIPEDAELTELCVRHGFEGVITEDSEYFFFACERKFFNVAGDSLK